MLWANLGVALTLAGSSAASILPFHGQPERRQIVPRDPTPDIVKITATVKGLGGTPKPAVATETATPLVWSTVIFPNATAAAGPPDATGSPTSVPKIIPRTISNEERLDTIQRRANPVSVDWRNHGSLNFLATVQDQGGCESCWVFAAVALVETQARIEHGYWSKRSEADLHDMMGVSCAQTGGPDFALNWVTSKGLGIADPQCDEYQDDDHPYFPCSDQTGRGLRVPAYTSVGNNDQKSWLTNVGPLAACFNVYADFYTWSWTSNTAYKWDGKSAFVGGHCILIVGYDDNIGGWLFRNSWGPSWGNKGYGYLGYGQVAIDSGSKLGMTGTNPDPWVKRRHHSGLFFESGNGANHRNFELFRSNSSGGIQQVWRSGDSPLTWSIGNPLLDGQTAHGQPCASGSSFNRDFQVVYVTKDGRLDHWYYSENRPGWFSTGPHYLGDTLAGYPGLTQTDDSALSVVVRTSTGALREYIRDSHTGWWTAAQIAAANTIKESGPSLVQSNVGLNLYDSTSTGNVYVVAVTTGGQLQLFQRAGKAGSAWTATEIFGSGVGDTPPVMIQDYWRTADETTPGGFQLLVQVGGQVQHWQRVNTDIGTNPPRASNGAGSWQLVRTFGNNVKHVWGLLQGSFGMQLEAIVEDNNGDMWHWQWTNAWNLVAKVPGVAGG